jgi:hypothetical protein
MGKKYSLTEFSAFVRILFTIPMSIMITRIFQILLSVLTTTTCSLAFSHSGFFDDSFGRPPSVKMTQHSSQENAPEVRIEDGQLGDSGRIGEGCNKKPNKKSRVQLSELKTWLSRHFLWHAPNPTSEFLSASLSFLVFKCHRHLLLCVFRN